MSLRNSFFLFAMCGKRTLFRIIFIRRRLAEDRPDLHSCLQRESRDRLLADASLAGEGGGEDGTLVPEVHSRAPVVSGTVQFRYADVSRRGLPTPIKHDSLTGRGEQSVARDRCLVGEKALPITLRLGGAIGTNLVRPPLPPAVRDTILRRG